MSKRRVLIVGAGFGGLQCAQALDGKAVEVWLLDRQNYHLFSPLLYQVASSLLNPSDIAYPIRSVFRASPNVRFRCAEVSAVELKKNRLQLSDGSKLSYHYLVLATGSATNFFGNRAVEKHALGLKSLARALQLRNHILNCLETASQLDATAQAAWMTFVIVGGGPTGIEYAGALAELMRLIVRKEYPCIQVRPRIVLVEGGARLLGAFPEKLGRYAEKRLSTLGVEVMTDRLVKSAHDKAVLFENGDSIETHTLVWSAGVKPATLQQELLTERSPTQRVRVDEQLQLCGQSRVFAIGDMASVLHDGEELPMTSPPAMQQGRYVAAAIRAHLNAKLDTPLEQAPFHYRDKGIMATVGRNAAVCQSGRLEFTGFVGWLVWLIVHIYYLIGFRNRLLVLWSWCHNYVWYDRPVRIMTRAHRPQDER